MQRLNNPTNSLRAPNHTFNTPVAANNRSTGANYTVQDNMQTGSYGNNFSPKLEQQNTYFDNRNLGPQEVDHDDYHDDVVQNAQVGQNAAVPEKKLRKVRRTKKQIAAESGQENCGSNACEQANAARTEGGEVKEKKPKKEKKSNIPETLTKDLKFKTQIEKLNDEVSKQTAALKDLKNGIKRLELSYDHDMNKAIKVKRKKAGLVKPTGFVKAKRLPKSLAELIGVQEGTEMSMPTYTRRFYEMLKEKQLFYNEDKRILRADDKMKEVFGLDDKVNESVDHKDTNGLNFYTLQKHIARVIKNTPVPDPLPNNAAPAVANEVFPVAAQQQNFRAGGVNVGGHNPQQYYAQPNRVNANQK
jgi:SWIB-domain-containing proteins implicated in chromatin remodeling